MAEKNTNSLRARREAAKQKARNKITLESISKSVQRVMVKSVKKKIAIGMAVLTASAVGIQTYAKENEKNKRKVLAETEELVVIGNKNQKLSGREDELFLMNFDSEFGDEILLYDENGESVDFEFDDISDVSVITSNDTFIEGEQYKVTLVDSEGKMQIGNMDGKYLSNNPIQKIQDTDYTAFDDVCVVASKDGSVLTKSADIEEEKNDDNSVVLNPGTYVFANSSKMTKENDDTEYQEVVYYDGEEMSYGFIESNDLVNTDFSKIEGDKYKTVVKGLRIRSDASIDAEKINGMDIGTEVVALPNYQAENDGKYEWYYIAAEIEDDLVLGWSARSEILDNGEKVEYLEEVPNKELEEKQVEVQEPTTEEVETTNEPQEVVVQTTVQEYEITKPQETTTEVKETTATETTTTTRPQETTTQTTTQFYGPTAPRTTNETKETTTTETTTKPQETTTQTTKETEETTITTEVAQETTTHAEDDVFKVEEGLTFNYTKGADREFDYKKSEFVYKKGNGEVSRTEEGYLGIDINTPGWTPEMLRKMLTKQNNFKDNNLLEGSSEQTPSFVILKLGATGYGNKFSLISSVDRAVELARVCNELGVPFGLYWFSQATTELEAKQEADMFIEFYKKCGKLEYNILPATIDVEKAGAEGVNGRALDCAYSKGRDYMTNILNKQMNYLRESINGEGKGHDIVVNYYCAQAFLTTMINAEKLDPINQDNAWLVECSSAHTDLLQANHKKASDRAVMRQIALDVTYDYGIDIDMANAKFFEHCWDKCIGRDRNVKANDDVVEDIEETTAVSTTHEETTTEAKETSPEFEGPTMPASTEETKTTTEAKTTSSPQETTTEMHGPTKPSSTETTKVTTETKAFTTAETKETEQPHTSTTETTSKEEIYVKRRETEVRDNDEISSSEKPKEDDRWFMNEEEPTEAIVSNKIEEKEEDDRWFVNENKEAEVGNTNRISSSEKPKEDDRWFMNEEEPTEAIVSNKIEEAEEDDRWFMNEEKKTTETISTDKTKEENSSDRWFIKEEDKKEEISSSKNSKKDESWIIRDDEETQKHNHKKDNNKPWFLEEDDDERL